ncbi:MAG: Co2+/Mg2+ efflux protein ApaG [Bdellovibrionaceae bacterium]|nr:Co2+/Mg2+ efflux protein ApaG [Pseudobdellovibrionaceae bacterium]
MTMQKTTTPRFEISASTAWIAEESRPEQGYHFFAYRISIKNVGEIPAQLISRHWIISDSHGRIEEVRGPGVVGQQPRIMPGETFEYESACPLNSPHGSMKGSYTMISDEGEEFDVEIPEFWLVSPMALH